MDTLVILGRWTIAVLAVSLVFVAIAGVIARAFFFKVDSDSDEHRHEDAVSQKRKAFRPSELSAEDRWFASSNKRPTDNQPGGA